METPLRRRELKPASKGGGALHEEEPLFRIARLAPYLVVLLLTGPVLAGLAGTILPAFSYLPALGGTSLSFHAFRAVFSEPNIVRSMALSVWTGFAATWLSVLIAAGVLAAGYGTEGWKRLMRILSPILSVPHAAAAYGLMMLVMPSGFLARLVSPELTGWQRPPDILIPNDPWGLALIAGLVAKEVPFLLLILIAAMGQADAPRSLQITNALGYGRLAGFFHALWPQLYLQVRFAVFAVLAFSATAVDVAVILGPSTPATLSVQLVRWMNDPDLAMRFTASAGAIVQLGLVLLLFMIWIAIEHLLAALRKNLTVSGIRFAKDGAATGLLRFTGWTLTMATLGGLALLGLWSVSGLWPFPDALPESYTLNAWNRALPAVTAPMATTFEAGIISAAIATLLCVLCLCRPSPSSAKPERRLFNVSLALPLIVPQTAFLFGLQIAAIKSGIGYGMAALVLVHLVFVTPYVFLSLSHAWQSLDPRYALVAHALGKSRTQTLLHVELPLLLRPVLTAFAVGFAVSAGLYLPTLLISAGRLPTITTEAVALASGSNRRIIGVYAFLHCPVCRISACLCSSRVALPEPGGDARLVTGRDMAEVQNQHIGLTLRTVSIRLRERLLLSIDSHVAPGSVLTVMGPSGSGKSTLLAFIGGFLDPAFAAAGSVLIDGQDMTGQSPQDRHAGILFQDPLLFPHMSVGQNLLFAIPSAIRTQSERVLTAKNMLLRMDLDGCFDHDPARLSGGQKARVALARTLVSQPRALLLDEPFSKLDSALRQQMRQLVFSLARERALPVVLVTHDPADAEAAGGQLATVG
jgi:putative thiamine transport system permease protein